MGFCLLTRPFWGTPMTMETSLNISRHRDLDALEEDVRPL